MSEVLIILVNYNGWEDTLECLESILKSNYKNFRIIVVDNDSKNNSFSEFKSWSKNKGVCVINSSCINLNIVLPNFIDALNVIFIKTDENNGFAYANNKGYCFAKQNFFQFDYVWLLNNDTVIEPDTLLYLVERMNNEKKLEKKVGILGSKLCFYSKPDILQGVGGLYNKYLSICKPIGYNEYDSGQYDTDNLSFDYVIGASMFVQNAFIEEVGLMNEEYFLYFEELDWILRGKKMGWNFGYEYRAKVFHKEGGTTNISPGNLSLIADVCQLKNRLIFTRNFYKPLLVYVVPVVFGSVINRLLRRKYDRAFVLFKTIFSTLTGFIFSK